MSALVALLLVPLSGADGTAARDTAAARVTITVRLGAGGKGTFRITGGPTDSGRVVAARKVSRGRLQMTQRLTGRYGTLVISSSQECKRATGTWKTTSGTRSYRAARGSGGTRGRVSCKRPWKPSTAAYSGALTTPQLTSVPGYARPVLAFSTDMSDFGGIATEDAADFNGDGFVDVVITRHNRPTRDTYPLLVFLNNGRGGFEDGTAAIFEGPSPRVQWPRKFVLADFNNDGRPDIFVADTGYDHPPGPGFHNTLVLSTSNGKLRDATANLPARIRFTHSATAADVNRDGSVDLYIGSIYTEARQEPPEIFLNDGDGTFRVCANCLPPLVTDPVIVNGSPQAGYTYSASQFVDVNNDRAPDLVLAGNGFYRLPTQIVSSDSQVLLNDGTGHFSVLGGALPPRPWNNTAEGLDVRSTDLNRDGFPDLAISYTQMDPFYVGRWVQILINNGNGTFRDETQARLPQTDNQAPWATQLSFVDLDGDGAQDLIAELVEGNREPTPFFLNDGGGRFRPLPVGYGNVINNDFALVDISGDGHRDFFASDDYTFPRINHYLVRELDAPRRPGIAPAVRVTRDATSGRPVVSWPYVWGAEQYEIWRSPTAGTAGRRIATTRLMRYLDATAAAGTAYDYSIRAVNGSGSSRLSTAAPSPAQ